MLRTICFALTPFFFLHAADPQSALVVSAANPNAGVTADSLATVYASHIASVTAAADGLPWPTALGDLSSVSITDSAGTSAQARLLFVSPDQMNLWIPPGLAPGIFTLDAGGVAAATAVRTVIPTTIQSPVQVFHCDKGAMCAPTPIDLGIDTPVYLSLFCTGIRGAAASDITVTIGDVTVKPSYAGPQSQIPGLDQVNVGLPLSLRGRGAVSITISIAGATSNPAKIAIQ